VKSWALRILNPPLRRLLPGISAIPPPKEPPAVRNYRSKRMLLLLRIQRLIRKGTLPSQALVPQIRHITQANSQQLGNTASECGLLLINLPITYFDKSLDSPITHFDRLSNLPITHFEMGFVLILWHTSNRALKARNPLFQAPIATASQQPPPQRAASIGGAQNALRQQELRQDPLAREEDKLLKEEERIRQVYVNQVGSPLPPFFLHFNGV
jgi:hypothetical protein